MTSFDIGAIMRLSPVIPVLVIDDVATAKPLAEALVSGGLPVLEVTLRTPQALDAIAEMANVEGAVVGAGTVLNATDLQDAAKAGAQFIVSPGFTEPLAYSAREANLAFLPGVSNASDIMRGLELGLTHFKFFPAGALGGTGALKALSGPFGQCRFCPTGGISLQTAPNWLALETVLCVGGSWVAPRGLADFAQVQTRAAACAALKRTYS